MSATDKILEWISSFPTDDYGSQEIRNAAAALEAGRPCVLTRGGYHNQSAGLVSDCINDGVDLRELRDETIRKALPALVAVNPEGARLLEALRWRVAESLPLAAE